MWRQGAITSVDASFVAEIKLLAEPRGRTDL
jgi:hypothetical protein